MRRVIRTNKWHSVEVRVQPHDTALGIEYEIRLAADQTQRRVGTYLTPRTAEELASVLLQAAKVQRLRSLRKKVRK